MNAELPKNSEVNGSRNCSLPFLIERQKGCQSHFPPFPTESCPSGGTKMGSLGEPSTCISFSIPGEIIRFKAKMGRSFSVNDNYTKIGTDIFMEDKC